jgi:predicted RNA-binding protein with PIN domain
MRKCEIYRSIGKFDLMDPGERPSSQISLAAVYRRPKGLRPCLPHPRSKRRQLGALLAPLSGPPYRWYAWANNFADAPNENVVKLISSANEPSKNRCSASRHAPNQRNPRPHHRQLPRDRPSVRARYLIVDGHSAIFGWPEMQRLHARRSSLARDALVKKLRDYQDYTGVRVVVVFDGKGTSATEESEPHSVQVFYSRAGQTADAIIERLASKYAEKFDLTVATSDLLEQETASACGAQCISIENLRALIDEAVPN